MICKPERPAVRTVAASARSCCCHHWLIDPPNGHMTSRGICKGCGRVKRFPNALHDSLGSRRFLDRPQRERSAVA